MSCESLDKCYQLQSIKWGSKIDQPFSFLSSDKETPYELPVDSRVVCSIKRNLSDYEEILVQKDITEDLTLHLEYDDYANLRPGVTYMVELVIVLENGEYLPPSQLMSVLIEGTIYGR